MREQRATESVWDYPRPPEVHPDHRLVRVRRGSHLIAETRRSMRVLETSHPPVFYIPPDDVDLEALSVNDRRTFCEFKGEATYWDLELEHPVPSVAWSYPNPSPGFEQITDRLAFYPSKVDCYVGNEKVTAQDGDFYGGWITTEIRGPFKGGPGTWGW